MTHNKFDSEYYLHFPKITANVPVLIFNPDFMPDRDFDFEENEPYNLDLIELEFNEPYPKKPVLVDFLYKSSGDLVVSEKFNDLLSPLKIEGVEAIPATIFDPKNKKKYGGYYLFHIYNSINCLDMEKAVYTKSMVGTVRMINKMVLDETVLSAIPLEKRLVFRLGEHSGFTLFHKSIVDKIMEQKPEGIRFVKVEDYHTGSAFD
jgi:hypothetical protein